jgi:hypothetical protein
VLVVLGLAALAAGVIVVLARRQHRGYVRALEERLERAGPAVSTAAVSTVGLEREALFEQVAAQQSWSERASHPVADAEEGSPREPRAIDAPAGDPVHERARVLRHGDAEAIRALLREEPIQPGLVPYAIALLARRDVYAAAVDALREVAPRSVPRLSEALLDPEQSFAIRRRVPRVLEAVASRESALALTRGLDDARFEVRYRCALALARLARRVPSLAPPFERVHEVVRRELEADREVWEGRIVLDEDEGAPLADRRARIQRSLEHVFTLLGLASDPEPLRLSLRALAGEDRALRGTALEYLENVLPDDIREGLFGMIDARLELRRRRSREELVDELVRSLAE